MQVLRSMLCLLPLFMIAACDEDDATSIRIRLHEDMSGTIVTSALQRPAGAGAVETAASGATFENRAELMGATGKFTSFSGLVIGDITFQAGAPGEGLRWLKIELPQGPSARWPDLFVPLSEDERMAATKAFDPTGHSRDTGTQLKIEIELPGPIIGNGTTGKVRGTKNQTDLNLATLIVPVAAARAGRAPLEWHITW